MKYSNVIGVGDDNESRKNRKGIHKLELEQSMDAIITQFRDKKTEHDKRLGIICLVRYFRYIINHRNTLKLDEIMGNFVFFIYRESVFNLKE